MFAQSIVTLAALLMTPTAPMLAGPTGQIILENSASIGGELYVDGNYQCHASPHASCIAEVSSGIHMAMILFDDGDYVTSDMIDVPADMSMTLPVRDLMS